MNSLEELIPRKKAHFIGVGGVGMSGLAHLLLKKGFFVSGSDVKANKSTKRLESMGAKIFIGHAAENVSDVDVVVFSSCICFENPELARARDMKIKCIPRASLLAGLMSDKAGITVAGAHGKTTTTALITYLLKESGLAPSFAVGADVDVLGGNCGIGEGKYFIAEADESDGSFLYFNPEYSVITNIDKEHLDYYKNLKSIIATYAKFIGKISPEGALFCYGEDKNIKQARKEYGGRVITYGLKPDCDIYAVDVQCEGMSSSFCCVYRGKSLGIFTLSVPGMHNVINSLAAIAIGKELGIDDSVIKEVLSKFRGADRRFQIRENINGVTIVDDYAHHPTEIMATLKAAKNWKDKRVVSVFQPHRYSRTKFLKKEFGSCFSCADDLVITDIYAASEVPIRGIGAETIYEQVKQSGHKSVRLLPKDKVNDYLMETVRKGDLLMMLGAGDIGSLTEDLIKRLPKREKSVND